MKKKNKSGVGYSNASDSSVIKIEEKFGANHYGRVGFVPRKTKGCWLTDRAGRKYFDCLACYSAANPGHHHPKIVKALVEALEGGYASAISNVVYTDPLSVFIEKVATLPPQLAPRFGKNGNKVLIKNGGVESVETALKIASFYGWKQKGIKDGEQQLIVFRNNFHGRTSGVVAFSSTKKYWEGFGLGRKAGSFIFVDYGDLDAVEKTLSNSKDSNICGILVEPMQGEGGMNVPPQGFLSGLRGLADKHDVLLIFDEIQVGLGRTGKLFCFEHENVIPDVLILGKSLSGGLVPLSVCLSNTQIMDMVFKPGSDGSTFGGYPLACVAGIAALDVLKEEKLVENSARMGKILKNRIKEIAHRSKIIKEVRGQGLFIGIEVHGGNAMKYCDELFKHGLLVNDSHGHTIRISPPLIITEKEVEYIVKRFEKVLV